MAGTNTVVNCIKCKKIVSETGNSICCDDCDGWIHLKCSGMTLKTFKKLAKDDSSEFKCNYCLNYKCGKCEKPVYPSQNAVQCDTEPCQTWFHLKCTHFSLEEYVNKKSRLHTESWYCPNCTCTPFDQLPQKAFLELQNDTKKLREFFNYVTSKTPYSEKCTVCDKRIGKRYIKKSFPCTSCEAYIHRKSIVI